MRSSQSFTPKLFFSLAAVFLAISYRHLFPLPRAMVLVPIYGKRVSLSCDISDILDLACNISLSVIHRGIHHGPRSA
jgi:hypothetical protein